MFREHQAGEISRFMSLTGLELVSRDDYYTFDFLSSAPEYSLAGGTYLGGVCTTTVEGEPWEIFRANSLVYNFRSGIVESIESVTELIELQQTANYFLSSGLIVPGSVTEDGSRVRDYAAYYIFDQARFKYSEVSFE